MFASTFPTQKAKCVSFTFAKRVKYVTVGKKQIFFHARRFFNKFDLGDRFTLVYEYSLLAYVWNFIHLTIMRISSDCNIK